MPLACIDHSTSAQPSAKAVRQISSIDSKVILGSQGSANPKVDPKLGNRDFLEFYGVARWVENWVSRLESIARRNKLYWHQPLINVNDDSEIVLEWWNGSKKLTIYISQGDSLEFIKVWGPDMHNEMEDGLIKSESNFKDLFSWIAN